ncbi:MAG: AAA family ATPase [Proteobacteria bacterium]|nr:AAA family ATPase [Pseudomonadota bacterium]
MIYPSSRKTVLDRENPKEKSSLDQVNFTLKPLELKDYLDRYIIQQDRAKSIIATKVCTHFNRIQFDRNLPAEDGGRSVGQIKNNIIMIGPTGVGKTYMIKLVAKKLGVPMVKADATKFSETGYVGGDVEDLIRQLYQEAGEDLELAEHGIVYLDEIDKIAASHHLIGPDVSRAGVQRALLKPMEETEVDIKTPHDPVSQLQAIERYRRSGKVERKTINTRNILFIVSGAFTDLAGIIKKRMQSHEMGFTADVSSPSHDARYLHHVRAEDLVSFGFESEFVGRLPVVAVLDHLTEGDLYDILKNPNNPIVTSKKKDFKSYDIDLKFDDAALRSLAARAALEKTGARGLVSAIERTLIPFEARLPSTNIRRLSVTGSTVEQPEAELKRLIEAPDAQEVRDDFERLSAEERADILAAIQAQSDFLQVKYSMALTPTRAGLLADFISDHFLDLGAAASQLDQIYESVEGCALTFFEKFGLTIEFTEAAADEMVRRVLIEGQAADRVCTMFTRDFEYGLNLIKEKTGQTRFKIDREAIMEPEKYLNDLITDLFQNLD